MYVDKHADRVKSDAINGNGAVLTVSEAIYILLVQEITYEISEKVSLRSKPFL